MNDTIRELMAQHETDGGFTHVAPTQEIIEDAQRQLGFDIPSEFLEYLNEYSLGGIGGVIILGAGFDGSMTFLETTLLHRKYGLPENLLAVENCDEWLYCIDSDTMEVVSWDMSDEVRREYPSFDDFLLQDLEDAIENL